MGDSLIYGFKFPYSHKGYIPYSIISRLPLGGQVRGWHTMDPFCGNESFQLGMAILTRQIGRLS
jgi:hypothetical protein